MFSLGKSMKQRREYIDLCDTAKLLELRNIERTIMRNFDSICAQLNKPDKVSQPQPNVLVTLPRLAQLLRDIWHASDLSDLSNLAYWRMVLRTLADQSWELACLVRDNLKGIDKANTQANQLYFQWSFSFFCIQLELEAMFPDNRFAGYKITSSEAAADWWQRQFGRSDCITWHDFQFALSRQFSIKSLAEANELKRDINVTGSDHVSTYEFDLFVRLFAPWGDRTLELWRVITRDHPAFVRFRFKEVKRLLKDQRPFSYLFRRSTNTPAVWSIGFINESSGVTQILVKPEKTIVEALTECAARGMLLYPAGKDSCHAPCLDAFMQGSPGQTTAKQPLLDEAAKPAADEIYVVAPKLRCSQCQKLSDEVSAMESCNHILCDLCFERHVQPRLYENWSMQTNRASFRHFCPVCREEETTTETTEGNAPTDAAKANEEVEIDLMLLDDSDDEKDAVCNGSPCWLADFDPMSAKAAASTASGEVYAEPNKTPREDPRPPVMPKMQTNPFLCDYALLTNSTSPQTQVPQPPPQQESQHGGYVFYGSKEDMQRLLIQVPGLKLVPLPASIQLPEDEEPASLYGQIWDGKAG